MEDHRRVMGLETEYGCRLRMNGRWYPVIGDQADPTATRFGEIMQNRTSDDLIVVRGGYASNGARLYWDQGHPEVSSAESPSITEILSSEVGSERELYGAFSQAVKEGRLDDFELMRRVVDDSNQWGRHENYMVPASIYPEHGYRRFLGPLAVFMAFRPLITGKGYVHKDGEFRLAQKASHVTHDFHRDTVSSKPLINMRQEPLAGEAWRRVHIPSVDPTTPAVTAMGMGVTSLFLRKIEMDDIPRINAHDSHLMARAVSADMSFSNTFGMELDGKEMEVTAIEFHDFVAGKLGELIDTGNATSEETLAYDMYVDRIATLRSIRTVMNTYRDPREVEEARDNLIRDRLSGKLDWADKYATLIRCAERKGVTDNIFASMVIRAADIALDKIGDSRRIYPAYHAMQSEAAQQWAPADLVEERRHTAPPGRARSRGEFIKATKEWPEQVSADWMYIGLRDVPSAPDGVLRVYMRNPFGDPSYDELVEKARVATPEPKNDNWTAI